MTDQLTGLPPAVQRALYTLKLSPPISLEELDREYQKACHTWNPARYAGLTNNPGKYMEMYKKGEAKTKEIQEAYNLLLEYLHAHEEPSSPGS